ncbi:hypothetical protein HK405_004683, partial [Cladochytrium tenue]
CGDVYSGQYLNTTYIHDTTPNPDTGSSSFSNIVGQYFTNISEFDSWVGSATTSSSGYFFEAFDALGCSVTPSTSTVRYLTTWLCAWTANVGSGTCADSASSVGLAPCASVCSALTDSYLAMLSDTSRCSTSASQITTVQAYFAQYCEFYALVRNSANGACTMGVSADSSNCGFGADHLDDAYFYCYSDDGKDDACCASLASDPSASAAAAASASSAAAKTATTASSSATSSSAASSSSSGSSAAGSTTAGIESGSGTNSSSNGGAEDGGGDSGSSTSSASSAAATSSATLAPGTVAAIVAVACVVGLAALVVAVVLVRRRRAALVAARDAGGKVAAAGTEPGAGPGGSLFGDGSASYPSNYSGAHYGGTDAVMPAATGYGAGGTVYSNSGDEPQFAGGFGSGRVSREGQAPSRQYAAASPAPSSNGRGGSPGFVGGAAYATPPPPTPQLLQYQAQQQQQQQQQQYQPMELTQMPYYPQQQQQQLNAQYQGWDTAMRDGAGMGLVAGGLTHPDAAAKYGTDARAVAVGVPRDFKDGLSGTVGFPSNAGSSSMANVASGSREKKRSSTGKPSLPWAPGSAAPGAENSPHDAPPAYSYP